ncbi:hypothetical protein [Treponema sp. R80B11-R83G3]
MKNCTKKHSLYFAALAVLVFAGCSNIFSPADLQESHPQKGLRITIANPVFGARTLYPDDVAPVFTRYELKLQMVDEPYSSYHSYPIVLTPENPTITIDDLTPGEWRISVNAFIDNTENVAAQIEDNIPPIITIDAQNSFQGIVIPLKMIPWNKIPGFFSWDIGYDYDKAEVEAVDLYVYEVGKNYITETVKHIDILTSGEWSGFVEISSRYYMMTVLLRTAYETISWTEVLHIYPGMTTRAERVFTDDDFTETIMVSGSVNIDVQVAPGNYDEINVEIYSDDDCTALIDSFFVYPSDGWWSWMTTPFDTPTNVYVKLTIYISGYTKQIRTFTVSLYDEDVTKNIVYLISDGTVLSGSRQITVNGNSVYNILLDAYVFDSYGGLSTTRGNVYISYFNNSKWSLTITPALDVPTEVLLVADIILDDDFSKEIFVNKPLSISPAYGISDIDFGDISARTVDVTFEGVLGTSGYTLYVLNTFRTDWRSVNSTWGNYWWDSSLHGKQVAYYENITESLSMLIPDTSPNTLYFVLEKGGTGYVTSAPVTSSGTVTLDISQMDPL